MYSHMSGAILYDFYNTGKGGGVPCRHKVIPKSVLNIECGFMSFKNFLAKY